MKLKILSWILSGIILFSLSVFAQTSTTGKLAGKVIDEHSHKPLIGANIFVEGTSLGGASDLNGNYFVLNIPSGTYSVKITYIGYETTIIKNVELNANRTTNLNIELKPSSVGLKEVVITSKRPAIIKDLTSSSTYISSKEIENAPVEGVKGVLNLSPGLLTTPNGDLQVRGGNSNDIKFYVDGVQMGTSINSMQGWGTPKNNSAWMYDFNTLGVKEIDVITGGFNAEYGNAQSGVVNIVSKEGSKEFHGEVRYEYGPPGKYHWGPYLYSTTATQEWKDWGSFSEWQQKLPMFPDSTLHQLYNQWIQNHTPGPNNKGGAYDYRKLAYQRTLFGFGGPLGLNDNITFYLSGEYRESPSRVPTNSKIFGYQNYNLNLAYLINPKMKLKLTGNYSYQNDEWGAAGAGNVDIRYAGMPNGGYAKYALARSNPQDNYDESISLNWLHSLSEKTFYNIIVSYQEEQSIAAQSEISGANDPWWIKGGPWDEGYQKNAITRNLTVNDVRIGKYYSKGDFSSQVSVNHLIKLGYEGKYWNVLYYGTDNRPPIAAPAQQVYYTGNPWYFAAYAQDKMEYGGMIANVGLRMDSYNMNTPMAANMFDPFYPENQPPNDTTGDPAMKMPSTKVNISPRIGVSFPIGENTAFHFEYGHFYSMPSFYETLYRRNYFGWEYYGNTDLGPSESINYELGIQQSIGGVLRLKVTGYYNDMAIEPTQLLVHAPTGRQGTYYHTWTNEAYGNSKGIEISLDKITSGRWYYSLNYSLSRVTGGAVGESELWSPDPNDPRNEVTRRSAASSVGGNDRTHVFNMIIMYTVPPKEGIDIFGIKPFSDMTISVIYRAQSGLPYTYVTKYSQYQDVVNNMNWPIETNTDLRIEKGLTITNNIAVTLSLRVTNLFDNKWLLNMTDPTDIKNWIERNITFDNPLSPEYKYNYYQAYSNETRRFYLGVGFKF